MLFYRFLSENLTGYINSQERTAGSADFDYAQLSDAEAERARDFVVSTKGSFILPFELFANVRKQAAGDQDLNEHLERIFKNIEGSAVEASSEKDIQGLFDDLDVNSAKLGNIMASCNAKLVKILDKIGSLLLDDFNEHEIDFFGDAYEFLMTIYASKAEKSGGKSFSLRKRCRICWRV